MQTKVKSKKLQSSRLGKQKKEFSFPLEKENFMIIGAGIVLLIIGYILMAQNSVDGFVPTVVSPIILVIGYCIVIPYGILKRPKSLISVTEQSEQKEETDVSKSSVSSNIKTGWFSDYFTKTNFLGLILFVTYIPNKAKALDYLF